MGWVINASLVILVVAVLWRISMEPQSTISDEEEEDEDV